MRSWIVWKLAWDYTSSFQDLKCDLGKKFQVAFAKQRMWEIRIGKDRKEKTTKKEGVSMLFFSFEIYYNYSNKQFDMDGFKLWCYKWCYFWPFFSWCNVEEAWLVFQKVWTICVLQGYQETWDKVTNSGQKVKGYFKQRSNE